MNIDDMELNVEAGVTQDEYEAPSEFFRPPNPGEYTFLRREKVDTTWSKDKKDLYFKFPAEIQGGAEDGQKVFFFVSTTVSQWRKSTSADDYVRACGSMVTSNGKRPLLKDYRDAVEGNPGPFNAVIVWKGYCSECEEETIGGKKQPKFPYDQDGNLLHTADCPQCGTKVGAKAVPARYVIP